MPINIVDGLTNNANENENTSTSTPPNFKVLSFLRLNLVFW